MYRNDTGEGPIHGHRQRAQTFGKDGACGFGDILAERQTHTQTYSSQYFTPAPAGDVQFFLVPL